MQNVLKKAIRLHQAGRLGEAGVLYERVLRGEPENATALHFYGLLLHNQGHSSNGIKLIRKALQVDPGYTSALHNLGKIYLERGEPGEAEEYYRRALSLEPGNVGALNGLSITLRIQKRLVESEEAALLASRLDPDSKETWYHLGRARQAKGDYPAAIESYIQATEIDPAFSTAQKALCRAIYSMELLHGRSEGEFPATMEAYLRWQAAEPDNPICQFMLAACRNDHGLKRAPDRFVVKMFDEFASEFDQNLADLNYRVPQLVADEVARVFAKPIGTLNILDAGCGTGLLAQSLAPWACRLTGVDLSPGMLGKARQRGFYDTLVEAELTEYLLNHTNAYDLIVCADTLVYFGDLETVLPAIGGSLKAGGTAIFTVEGHGDSAEDYHLGVHGRYSHNRRYIERCSAIAGMAIESLNQEILRNESAENVHGFLVTTSKPARA